MPVPADVLRAVRDALPGADSWYAIFKRISDAVPAGEETHYRSLVWAFGYDLVSPGETERLEREGSPFGAMWEMDGQRLPPRLSDVPDEAVEEWAEAFAAIDDPRLRSRLGDLLWERKHPPRPDIRARAACEALVEVAQDEEWALMQSTEALVRALALSTELSDGELQAKVVAATVAAITDELTSEHDRPGIPFNLLEPLTRLPERTRPTELEALIARAAEKYGADPYHAETALELRVAIAAPPARAELRRHQVRQWRQAAAQAEGLVRLAFLERALDVARTHGLAGEARELRVELGRISDEELDLKKVSVETKLDSDLVEKYLASFTDFDNWSDALIRFGVQGPPGSEPEELDKQVEEQMQRHPLQFLTSKVVLDPDTGVAIFHAVDELSHRQAAIAEHRALAARFWSVFAVDILRRIGDKYSQPEHNDLTRFFVSAFIDEATADRVARAVHLWWAGETDEAAHVLAPRLEAIIREVARQLGLPVIREPRDGKPGGVRSLGDILFSLKGRLPTPGWHAYLFSLLSDPLGPNLRNVVGHGMRPRISTEDAALLLHAACFLRLLEGQAAHGTHEAVQG
jgi:hypothetical protein